MFTQSLSLAGFYTDLGTRKTFIRPICRVTFGRLIHRQVSPVLHRQPPSACIPARLSLGQLELSQEVLVEVAQMTGAVTFTAKLETFGLNTLTRSQTL